METKEELLNEMFEEWLWERIYGELKSQAIKEIESKYSFIKNCFNPRVSKEIIARHRELFQERLSSFDTSESNDDC